MKNTILILITSLFILSCQQNEKVHPKPNIILFLVDDMGWQDTSLPFWKQKTPLNYKYKTPNMERLAKQGVKFTQAYATPICSPSRVSLLTGMNAARHRVTNWTLRKNFSQDAKDDQLQFPKWNVNGISTNKNLENAVYATTLPQILKNNGYTTIHVGKAHFGAIGTPSENPLNIGFDVNIAGHASGAPQSYLGMQNFGNDTEEKSVWAVPGLEKYHQKDIFLTEALTLEAINALDTIIGKKPFFLYMAHYGVHVPLMADKRYYKTYTNAGLEKVEAKYASMIEGVDKSLGDLMDYVEEKNIANNTIIIFMSDNGGLSASSRGGKKHTHNAPLASGKGSMYEGGIREPMLVKWPKKVAENTVINEYVIIEDFYPTILEMANISNAKVVQKVDGKSFVSKLLHPKTNIQQNRPLFWHFPNKWGSQGPGIGTTSAIRKGDWKLIYYHKSRKIELFNIKNDISEKHNLAAKNPKKANELAKVLSNHLRNVNAQMPFDIKTQKRVEFPDEIYK